MSLLVWKPLKNALSLREIISKNWSWSYFSNIESSYFYHRVFDFLQATSMSYKFAITLPNHFCSFSFQHFSHSRTHKTARDSSKSLIHFHTETYILELLWETSTEPLTVFEVLNHFLFCPWFKTIMDSVKPISNNIKKR